MVKYFSLFSGIGGFELGILRSYGKKNCSSQTDTQSNDATGKRLVSKERERVGSSDGRVSEQSNGNSNSRATCIGFSEIDRYATQIYKKHFPSHKEYGDVTNIKWSDVPDFEFLCGGFPCQSFSIAGKRGGFSDTRGTLFFEIARAAQEKQPRLLLLENVKGLLSHDKGRTFSTILNTLDELGYDLQWQVLNSKNFGVPQNRERVFIIGHLRGTPRPQVFPLRTSNKINGEIQSDQDRQKARSSCLNTRYGQRWTDETYIKRGRIRTNESSTRPQGDKPDSSNCIRRATYSDDMRIRRLTPTECERLQGFPDEWTSGISDTQRYKCLGNAVTVNVISAIMKKYIETFNQKGQKHGTRPYRNIQM